MILFVKKMKKLFLFVAIFLLTISLNSCSKDSADSSTPTTNGTFKCKVDGVQKTFGTNTFLAANMVNVVAYIGSKETSTENIWLTANENSTTIWDFIYVDVVKQFTPTSNFALTITNNNTTTKTIKGTFSGTVKNLTTGATKTLSEGVFDINY